MAPPERWFAGSTAVVTAAGRGIGRGIASRLIDQGARVVTIDNEAETLDAPSDLYIPRRGDMAAGDVAELAEAVWSEHGPVDLLVNNVGIDTPHRFTELDEETFDRVWRTNLRGPWFFTKRLVEHMIDEQRGGAIVFISSLHESFIRTLPHYSTSKAALSMLVRELAQELAHHGIRVNSVSPGVVESGHVRAPSTPEEQAEIERIVPLGRIGQPDDVARMTAVLLSDEWSGYVTGANVRVDGGLGLHSWSVDHPAQLYRSTPMR
jgi:NAD(P)-dependent dehydrogenase (short-subunit alcohol dehydrogenase family)